MATREKPNGSTEIKPGLWAYLNVGTKIAFYTLYAAQGYCFYNEKDEPSERTYAQYAVLAKSYNTIDKIKADFIAVPVQDGNLI